MRKVAVALVTAVTFGAIATSAMACPYSGHGTKKETKETVVIGS